MASTDKPAAVSVTKSEAAAPPPPPPAADKCPFNYTVVDVALRVLVFAASLCSVVVVATSKETELVQIPVFPFRMPRQAKFNHSPALIYFIAALSVTGLYSIITTLASLSILLFKPTNSKTILLLFAFFDVVFVGIVASATGAAGAVAYIGLRGNRHVNWIKVCGVYDKFCRYVGSSIALSLFAAILLVLLSMISTFTLYKKIRD